MLNNIRQRSIPVIVLACAILPIILIWLLSRWINARYSEFEGTITAIVALLNCYLFIASLFYVRNERFYLFVNRQLLKLRRTHTHWKISAQYEGVTTLKDGQNQIDELSQKISDSFLRVFPNTKTSVQLSRNEIQTTVDDGDRFTLRLDHDNDHAYFTTSRMRVPSNFYSAYLRQNVQLLVELEKVLVPSKAEYRLEIEFDKNPYFGFFLRNVPIDLVKAFHCTFNTTIRPGYRVEVSRTAVAISSRECFGLEEVVNGYLSLSTKLMQDNS